MTIVNHHLSSIVYVEVYEKVEIIEGLFTEEELSREHYIDNAPTLDMIYYVEYDSIYPVEQLVGQYFYSAFSDAKALLLSSEVINGKAIGCFKFINIPVKLFVPGETLSHYFYSTHVISNDLTIYVYNVLEKKPKARTTLNNITQLLSSLSNRNKRIEKVLGKERSGLLDIVLVERDKKTSEWKTWFLQANKLPEEHKTVFLRDSRERDVVINTQKGNYVISGSIPEVVIH